MTEEIILNVSNTAIRWHLCNYLPNSLTIQHWEGLLRSCVKSLLYCLMNSYHVSRSRISQRLPFLQCCESKKEDKKLHFIQAKDITEAATRRSEQTHFPSIQSLGCMPSLIALLRKQTGKNAKIISYSSILFQSYIVSRVCCLQLVMRAILFQTGASQRKKLGISNLIFDCMIKQKITMKHRMPYFPLFQFQMKRVFTE